MVAADVVGGSVVENATVDVSPAPATMTKRQITD
jgi:hypothetical protein